MAAILVIFAPTMMRASLAFPQMVELLVGDLRRSL